jgi:SIR2-like domain
MNETPLETRRFECLREDFASGRLTLFTGAGFSADARDLEGRPIPSTDELREELWGLCFPEETPDDSVLSDLFSHALTRCPRDLQALLNKRLTVDPQSLPSFYRTWHAMPWRRIYTLNVDDLEIAVARRFELPRPIRPISALGGTRGAEGRNAAHGLACIHLNGIVTDAPEGVTFSTGQYARRIGADDRWYGELGEDLDSLPFVFVGTRLDEPSLWQHLECHAARRRTGEAPRSLLVTRRLSRARASLLEQWGIDWLRATSEEFARRILEPLSTLENRQPRCETISEADHAP